MSILKGLNDDRIRIINNPRNMGISKSRNVAIENASGKYLAWLDSDDIATRDRLEKQVEFLESHDDYCMCCGNMIVIDSNGNVISGPVWESTNLPVMWSLFWENPVAQSSVMIRQSIFTAYKLKYISWHAPAEDYNMWCQLALIGKIHRLNDVVLKYRSLETSALHSNQQRAMILSLEFNESLVRDVVGTCPDIHGYLTTFAWVLPDRFVNSDLSSVINWLNMMKAIYCDRFSPSKSEIMAIDRDIYRMLLSKTSENWQIFNGLNNKYAMFRQSRELFLILIAKKICRDFRRVFRFVKKMFFCIFKR
jgi:glycosyltransferase involved in cell wall biosynthesis